MRRKRMEGYLHRLPYAGDGWYLTRERREQIEDIFAPERIDEQFDNLVGKKIRITIEILED